MWKPTKSEKKCYDAYFAYQSKRYAAMSTEQIGALRDEWLKDINKKEYAFQRWDHYPYSNSLESHPSSTTAIVPLNDEIAKPEQVKNILDWLIEKEEQSFDDTGLLIAREALLLANRKELRRIVSIRALASLSKIESQTYSLFMEGNTQSEIAKKRQVSRQAVSDCMREIVKKLSEPVQGE